LSTTGVCVLEVGLGFSSFHTVLTQGRSADQFYSARTIRFRRSVDRRLARAVAVFTSEHTSWKYRLDTDHSVKRHRHQHNLELDVSRTVWCDVDQLKLGERW